MNKQLLSVLCLSLLVSLAPSCKKETNGKNKKSMRKNDMLNRKSLAAMYDDADEDFDRTLADANIEEDEVVTQI